MLKKYFVYRNLHNGKWSLKDMDTGLVVGHATHVVLARMKTKVSEAGRQRVLLEKKKNVHAGLVGCVTSVKGFESFKGRGLEFDSKAMDLNDIVKHFVRCGLSIGLRSLSYNPYKMGNFFDKEDYRIVRQSHWAMLHDKGVMYLAVS